MDYNPMNISIAAANIATMSNQVHRAKSKLDLLAAANGREHLKDFNKRTKKRIDEGDKDKSDDPEAYEKCLMLSSPYCRYNKYFYYFSTIASS